MSSQRFYDVEPTPENYWRAIILFGRNSASYKFALAHALAELRATGRTDFVLDEVAVPFASHLCAHLATHPRQATTESSRFLDGLRDFNAGKISKADLIAHTVRFGFANVIDAFHVVHGSVVPEAFFIDRRADGGGITLSDIFMRMGESDTAADLDSEVNARWRLVEAAWAHNVNRNLLRVEVEDEELVGMTPRRVPLTSARPALNGYQKGRCFYCFRPITTIAGLPESADVDHFFPHRLKACAPERPVDGVANLVLACSDCNRGPQGKSDRIPSIDLLDRLYLRNEYLIGSHHPLRETLIAQSGHTAERRRDYLQDVFNCAALHLGARHKWQPAQQGTAIF